MCIRDSLCTVSSCSLLIQGGATGVNVSTYPSEDADMLAAEAQYCAMEAELQQYLDCLLYTSRCV